jgi:ABC-type dipeptide/oligopeptide/nickel transport system ATPase component
MLSSWQQGEHVSIIGPTGCGKTTLESRLLDVRDSVAIFVTKIHDDTISRDFPGYERIEKWPPPKAWQNKVLLWPRPEATIRETYIKQRRIFKDALDQIFRERNWCVVFDEQHYMCKQLGLDAENMMILQQGRSSGLSVVNGTQRPAWVPLVTYSSATHAFIWRTTHREDLRKLADLGGIEMRQLQGNLMTLGKHDFIYVNTRKGDVMRSRVSL